MGLEYTEWPNLYYFPTWKAGGVEVPYWSQLQPNHRNGDCGVGKEVPISQGTLSQRWVIGVGSRNIS